MTHMSLYNMKAVIFSDELSPNSAALQSFLIKLSFVIWLNVTCFG